MSISPLLVYGFIWIRVPRKTKGISAKPSMEKLGIFSHITHELPLVFLHPWSLNPGNNSPRQNLSVVLGSNMDANCFQKSRTRQSNKRTQRNWSWDVKRHMKRKEISWQPLISTVLVDVIDFSGKENASAIEFLFVSTFFLISVGFLGLKNKFQVNIAGVAKVGIDHGGRVVWRWHHPTIRGPSVGHLLVPTCLSWEKHLQWTRFYG